MMLPAWLTKTVALVIAIGVALLLIAGLFAWHEWSVSRTAKVETKLATGQAQASLQSGQDAVQTTGSVEANSSAVDLQTKENADAIQNTEGAGAPVAPAVRDIGIASLCRHPAHRRDPKCLQLASPH